MKVLIIGGDKRFVCLKDTLIKNNYNVNSIFLNHKDEELTNINDYNVILLPIPFSKNNLLNAPFYTKEIHLNTIINMLKDFKGKIIGGLNESNEKLLKENNLNCLNILKDENFTLINAIITAEGAISKLIIENEESLFESNVCILGYGRVSKALSRRLDPLCKNLTIYNNPSTNYTYTKIDNIKSKTIDNFKNDAKNYQIIINTIPSLIINESILNSLNPSTLIMDLASLPGGVDFKKSNEKNIKTLHYLGIPGKISSKSASNAIFTFFTENI